MSFATVASLLGLQFVRCSVVLLAALAGTSLLRGRTAAGRHAVWMWAMVAVLALPVVAAIAPSIQVRRPALVERVQTAFGAASRRTMSSADRSAVNDNFREGANSTRSEGDVSRPIVFVWAIGVLLVIVGDIRSTLALRRLLRRARPVEDQQVLALFHRLGGRSVALVTSNEVVAPATALIIRPVVLLPADACEWSTAKLSQVLTHELAHVRRRDCLTHAIARVACAFYWYNPLVWIGLRRMIIERERACDDLVLSDGASPLDYARVLVDAAHTALSSPPVSRGVLAMARPSELEQRIVAILSPRSRRGAMSRSGQLLTAGLFATMTLGVSAVRVNAAVLLEPDLRGDAVAPPSSELIPGGAAFMNIALGETASLTGPDSLLSQALHAALFHSPTHAADLIRDRSAWILAQSRDGQLVEPLIEHLRDSDWRARAYAAWGLGTARDPRAVLPLLPSLSHPVWRERAMAAFALREIGDSRATDAMLGAVDDEAWQVRLAAVQFAATLGTAESRDAVRRHLGDRHIAVRSAAQAALSK